MSTYKKADAEVRKLATEILNQFESHKPLIDAKVNIDYVFAYGERDDDGILIGDALTKNGSRALGITRKMSLKDRAMGRGDAEISLDGDWWTETAGEEMQRALLDHELHHVALKTTKGQFNYDALGRPVLRLRKHDVEIGWFSLIASRHGKHSLEQMQAKVIMDAMGQFFWPQIAPQTSVTKQKKNE